MSFGSEMSEVFWASPEGVSLDAMIKRLRRIEEAMKEVEKLAFDSWDGKRPGESAFRIIYEKARGALRETQSPQETHDG